MDRTILLWMGEEYSEVGDGVGRGGGGGGIWTPISRVGSAGGILGGSLGASLIGFVDAAFSPDASRIVGHGYGGSIHFWSQAVQSNKLAIDKHPIGGERAIDILYLRDHSLGSFGNWARRRRRDSASSTASN